MTYILGPAFQAAVDAVLPYFPYTCEVMAPVAGTKDSIGGTPAPTYSSIGSVKGIYEALRTPATSTLANKQQVVLTHALYLPFSSTTSVITERYQILVNALGDEAEITFKNPVKAEGAFTGILVLHCSIASLV